MRSIRFLVLYAGIALGANVATADTSALIALAEGDLARIQFHGTPKPVAQTPFHTADGKPVTLADYRGKHVVLNFWALWCAPCREEMPALDNLQTQLGSSNFEVVTVAAGRNAKHAVDKFFIEAGIKALPKLFDPKMALARSLFVRGLPVTVLIGPDGQEIGRASGEFKWDSPAAIRLFKAWMANS